MIGSSLLLRSLRSRATGLLTAAVLALGAGTSAPASAQGSLPDSAGGNPGALPVPLLLVPGWGDQARELASLRAWFIEAGWPPGRVVAMEFDDPVGSNRLHAVEVGAEVDALRRATAADEVDIVAHSMGGLAVRHLLAESGGAGVRRVVFLATPHRGTVAAYLAWGEGSEEMEPGSPFLDSLNAGSPVPEDVRVLAVRTPVDMRVVPGESAHLPDAANVRNVEVCCPTHPGLLEDPQTFREMVAFLASDRPLRTTGDGG